MAEIPASHRDLIENSQVVLLATNGADGYPQVTAVWFLLTDAGDVAISLNTARQKTKNLAKNPESTLFFIDAQNPYRTLEIRATARIEADPGQVFAGLVGAKYGSNVSDHDQPGDERVAVHFTPVKVNTFG